VLRVLVEMEVETIARPVLRVLLVLQFQLPEQPQIMQVAAVAVAGFLIPLVVQVVQVVAVQVVVEVEVHLEQLELRIQVVVVDHVLQAVVAQQAAQVVLELLLSDTQTHLQSHFHQMQLAQSSDQQFPLTQSHKVVAL
jgi:hypothetical protein